MPDVDVVTFGETMIRLSPPGHERLEVSDSLDLRVGGSESNTAAALARLGRRVSWWSKLVDNPLGRRVESALRARGVDTSHVLWSDSGRMGLYFIEFGAVPRPHHVYYDRAGSSASAISPDEVQWDHLDGARHLHVTGITCALSASCLQTVERAVSEARSRGLTVSLDVNYRKKLWSPADASAALRPLLNCVDLAICPASDAAELFGFLGSDCDIARRMQIDLGAPAVVVTAGLDGAVAVDAHGDYHAAAIEAREIDRVGGGDAFDAGVIDGFLDGDLLRGIRYGVAMAALKRTMPGDELIATREEIEALVAGSSAGINR